MWHVVLRHDQESSIPKVFQLCYTCIEMHKCRPMRNSLFFHCMPKSSHDPFEDQTHEISMTNKYSSPPCSCTRPKSIVALFMFFPRQCYSCIKDIMYLLFLNLAKLLIEIFHHPNIKFGSPLLRFMPSLGPLAMRIPSILFSILKPLKRCIFHTRRVQKRCIDLFCIHARLNFFSCVTTFTLKVKSINHDVTCAWIVTSIAVVSV
mmetsp:Transcript_23560/g.42182  ORF Transcript_23560/g.42182 Transcript_23560/m.42182 type:complete len:205 (-) Transcript_23560:466-1080(-)